MRPSLGWLTGVASPRILPVKHAAGSRGSKGCGCGGEGRVCNRAGAPQSVTAGGGGGTAADGAATGRSAAATAPTTADPNPAVSVTAGDEMVQEFRWGRVPAHHLNLCAKPGAISFWRPNLGFNNGFNITECADARIFLP